MVVTFETKNSFVHFKLNTSQLISREDAVRLQAEKGYDYKKNGLYAFIVEKIRDQYQITWACRS
jgi:hypothetical protein